MGWRVELLKKLVEHDVRVVVIGGVAAIAYGSAQVTEDLDVSGRYRTRTRDGG